jgi:fatty-acid peroxygenase
VSTDEAQTDGPAAPLDRSLQFLLRGYPFAMRLRAHYGSDAVRTRLLGQRAVVLGGKDAVRLFYDNDRFQRAGAIPEPVRGTLFGRGALHTLDGQAHRDRKQMLMAALDPGAVAALGAIAATGWAAAADRWAGQERVVLFDEAVRVLGAAVTEWAGIPIDAGNIDRRSADLATIVDGFGGAARQLPARLARRRAEAWAAAAIADVRAERLRPPPGSALVVIASHLDGDGQLLDSRTAAVELLNVLRPTVAVAWLITFGGLALHQNPRWRQRLALGDPREETAFAEEVRRFYPFTPVLGARARTRFEWGGQQFSPGQLTILDIYGTLHDPRLWPAADRFDPERFLTGTPDPNCLVPQGGGDPATGHRCPGEGATVEMIKTAMRQLARTPYRVPEQDLRYPLHRMPTRPRSGFVFEPLV